MSERGSCVVFMWIAGFGNIFFAGYRILGWYLALGTFKMLLYCLLVYAVSGCAHLVANLTDQVVVAQRRREPCHAGIQRRANPGP